MSENNKLQCEGCITISSLYLYIWLYIYAFHCIQTTIVMNCQMIWEMFPAFQSLKLVSFISTPRSRVQGTFHVGGHTNIGPTIRWCNAAFLNFPHMYCLLLRKTQVVHRICFAVITAVRGDLGKHQLWLSQTNSNIKQIKHFRSWIPVYKKWLYLYIYLISLKEPALIMTSKGSNPSIPARLNNTKFPHGDLRLTSDQDHLARDDKFESG